MRKEFRMLAPGTITNTSAPDQKPSAFKKGGSVPSIEITINHNHGKKSHSKSSSDVSNSRDSRGGYFSRHHETPAHDYHEHFEKYHQSTQPSGRDLISEHRERPRQNIARDEPTETWAEMNGISKKVKTPAEDMYLGKQNARRVKTGGYLALEQDKAIRAQEKKLLHASNAVERGDRKHPNNRTKFARHAAGDMVSPDDQAQQAYTDRGFRPVQQTQNDVPQELQDRIHNERNQQALDYLLPALNSGTPVEELSIPRYVPSDKVAKGKVDYLRWGNHIDQNSLPVSYQRDPVTGQQKPIYRDQMGPQPQSAKTGKMIKCKPEHHGFGDWIKGGLSSLNKGVRNMAQNIYDQGRAGANGPAASFGGTRKSPQPQAQEQPQMAKRGKLIKKEQFSGATKLHRPRNR